MSNQKSTLINQIQQLAGVECVSHLPISPESDDFMVVEICFSPESVVDRLTPEEIALRNYNAQLKRKTITDKTTFFDFTKKLNEEYRELIESYAQKYYTIESGTFDSSELADISLVCDAMALHYAIDLQLEKQKKMIINENRTD